MTKWDTLMWAPYGGDVETTVWPKRAVKILQYDWGKFNDYDLSYASNGQLVGRM